MNLEIVTVVLDGMPWITRHWPEYEKLSVPWRWHVVEGVAANVNCTSWCDQLTPRLSNDGTTEYLNSITAYDPRVILHRKEQWQGKVSMMNEPLRYIHQPCLLLQADSDELWTCDQLETLIDLFDRDPSRHQAMFYADYRVGRNLHITSLDTYGNNTAYEWRRAWRWKPGMRFRTHEPPSMEHCPEMVMGQHETSSHGLTFRHEAYSTESQVAFKQHYYGSTNNAKGSLYANAVDGWRRLQHNQVWPVKELKDYLPWVGDGVIVDKI